MTGAIGAVVAAAALHPAALPPPAAGAQEVAPRRTGPRAPATARPDTTFQRRLGEFRAEVEALRRHLGIPGMSVAVSRKGEVVWSGGLGRADPATDRPARAGTPYRIASIAKTMTAVVVVGLAREGRLALDDTVARHLDDGEEPAWARRVTVRHLLSHTSQGPSAGQVFAYSGRYDALARVVEGVTGRSLAEEIRARVLEPAGMASSVPVSLAGEGDGPPVDALARPHRPDGTPPEPGVLPDRTVGGNGMISTAPDLISFVGALEEGALLDREAVAGMWSPSRTADGARLPYGLGWWVESTPSLELVWHGGQWPVYSGLLLHVRGPGPMLTLALLANSPRASSPFYDIGTGTALFSSFGAAFLRHLAAERIYGGEPPRLSLDAAPGRLEASGRALVSATARYHYGAELLGRSMAARTLGRHDRADALAEATLSCCPESLDASADLGLLFHLARSGDPGLRVRGREAGTRRLERAPHDPVTRFHLGASFAREGRDARARLLLEEIVAREDEVPGWMWGWSAYFVARALTTTDPARAARLLERVMERGVDESGLLHEAGSLLARVEGS